MKKTMLLVGMFLALNLLTAQTQQSQLAKVFVLGQAEERYEQLTSTYTQTLLGACQNNIQVAFDQWLVMMRAIDEHAGRVNFNLKGVKVWLHVFWAENGTIDHLGFLLRPDSRYVEEAELRAFFADFVSNYQFSIKSDRKYSHYTGATFPTLSEKAE